MKYFFFKNSEGRDRSNRCWPLNTVMYTGHLGGAVVGAAYYFITRGRY